jgi:hypothetical protein
VEHHEEIIFANFEPINLIILMIFNAKFIIILSKSFFLIAIFPDPFLTESSIKAHFKADFIPIIMVCIAYLLFHMQAEAYGFFRI